GGTLGTNPAPLLAVGELENPRLEAEGGIAGAASLGMPGVVVVSRERGRNAAAVARDFGSGCREDDGGRGGGGRGGPPGRLESTGRPNPCRDAAGGTLDAWLGDEVAWPGDEVAWLGDEGVVWMGLRATAIVVGTSSSVPRSCLPRVSPSLMEVGNGRSSSVVLVSSGFGWSWIAAFFAEPSLIPTDDTRARARGGACAGRVGDEAVTAGISWAGRVGIAATGAGTSWGAGRVGADADAIAAGASHADRLDEEAARGASSASSASWLPTSQLDSEGCSSLLQVGSLGVPSAVEAGETSKLTTSPGSAGSLEPSAAALGAPVATSGGSGSNGCSEARTSSSSKSRSPSSRPISPRGALLPIVGKAASARESFTPLTSSGLGEG
ncbi:MAG TPA: hypothetical protein VKP30_12105, partial [Polyangiaceae bacterium]|nr:hypothetical protein [Polyangiaceae bacterium]